MHALRIAIASGFLLLSLGACSKKVTQTQCDAIVSRYAEFIVRESGKDASAAEIKTEQAHAVEDAKNDDDFRNCTSQIEPADYDCAMKATSSHAIEKCLE